MSEKKIKLEGLQIGMYVSRVDRPWRDIPVPFEGLLITKNSDIDLLKQYCQYVVIDNERGRDVSPMYWIEDDNKANEILLKEEVVDPGKNEFTLLRKEDYEVSASLEEEVSVAKNIYKNIKKNINDSFNKLRLNKEVNLQRLHESIMTTVGSVIRNPTAFKLILELEQSDNYVFNHALRSSVWCAQIGRELGFAQSDINELALGGLLLDVGKTQLDTSLLNKKEAIAANELAVLQSHVDRGVQLLASKHDIPLNVLQMVATHHERFDKSGYPQHLENERIPIFGRIGGIVDCYDAMTSKRPFRPRAFSPHEAINNLYQLRNQTFQKELVEQFIKVIGVYPAGSLVELQSGEVGMVIAVNEKYRLRPKIMIILDSDKKFLSKYYLVDLSMDRDLCIKRALEQSAYGIKMNEMFLANICQFFN